MTYLDKVAQYFEARPGEWIDGLELERVGGRYAWRTRVSECRQHLGMQIENRQRTRADGATASEYRYTGFISRDTACKERRVLAPSEELALAHLQMRVDEARIDSLREALARVKAERVQ